MNELCELLSNVNPDDLFGYFEANPGTIKHISNWIVDRRKDARRRYLIDQTNGDIESIDSDIASAQAEIDSLKGRVLTMQKERKALVEQLAKLTGTAPTESNGVRCECGR